jgi:hydroxymethylpyrimidine/phosphomethylpyrimidine kinase
VGDAHGTGCTLSAAIAAGLAHGRTLEDAVDEALAWTRRAIETAPPRGGGSRPLNHWAPR